MPRAPLRKGKGPGASFTSHFSAVHVFRFGDGSVPSFTSHVGIIFAAVYMLWMYQRTFLGKTNSQWTSFPDLSPRDWAPLLPLIVLMVWLGIYTQSFMPTISGATSHLLEQTNMNNQYQVLAHPGAGEVADAR